MHRDLSSRPKRVQEHWVLSHYFAPRGKERLLALGEQLCHLHLSFTDRLIGFIGDSGSGKSSLIKGIFPGLELSNDDDILNPRKIMQVRVGMENLREASTYHIDMRFQTAFAQMYEIVEFVQKALDSGKRVVVEHFNLLNQALGRNADLLFAIGEEIIVTRPSVFGPQPQVIYDLVHHSLLYRKMAHSAEEVTAMALEELFGITTRQYYSADIHNGYVLKFNDKPSLSTDDLMRLEKRILELIDADMEINYYDEDHIMLGDQIIPCDGPRLHMSSTGEIENFSLLRRLIYDARYDAYCLVGLLDPNDANEVDISNRNTYYFMLQ